MSDIPLKDESLTRRQFFRSFPRELFKSLRQFHGNEAVSSKTKDRIAILDINRCLAWGGLLCQSCYLACHLRDQAITMNDQKPVIHANACDGCGVCVDACQTVNNPSSIAMK